MLYGTRVDHDKLAKDILDLWIPVDEAGAFAAIEGVTDIRLKLGALRYFLQHVAQTDSSKAYEYLASSSVNNDVLRKDVVTALHRESPRRAINLLGTFDSTLMANAAAQNIVGHWCSANLNECIAWFESEASESMQRTVIRQVVLSYASQDLRKASEWVKFHTVEFDAELRESIVKILKSMDIDWSLSH